MLVIEYKPNQNIIDYEKYRDNQKTKIIKEILNNTNICYDIIAHIIIKYVCNNSDKNRPNISLIGCIQRALLFVGHNIQNSNFSYSIFHGCNFSNCNFSGVNFRYVDLTLSHFLKCNFTNAILDNAILTNASFTDCNLENASIQNSNLTRCKMFRSNCSDVNFGLSNLTSSRLKYTTFHGANFTGVNINDSNIIGSDFTYAILDSTNIVDAYIAIHDRSPRYTIYTRKSSINGSRSKFMFRGAITTCPGFHRLHPETLFRKISQNN
jgi:uncharacterized protein YjbI with pentapeptide repeats